ncbi:MAG: CRISPR-associated endoribonuclease Cas6 [Bacteroidales bacterium]|nr:CRISPR-associated endoribonuclease Cas6 [Bacteroidales bacterium]MDD2425704.1 CRISPR-associated endoribonuclease Cas6 [Bacteroidales bacterium]MDD3989549.1 CRISPR-associated endoribonuclease Cas6 [Bacteroidales bacterium]
MRIHLKLKSNQKIIPFEHQHLLTGTIHKWIGFDNNEHGNVSLYSFSQLQKGQNTLNGLFFDGDSSFFFSAHNDELIKKVIAGIQSYPNMFCGLEVNEVIIQDNPDFSNRNLFFLGSPIFIKRKINNNIEHILFDDSRADLCLEDSLKRKMNIAGLEDESLRIKFDKASPYAKTKMITYDGIKNRTSWCPVIIEGKPETKLFAWNVGLGNSTGIGFGSIK